MSNVSLEIKSMLTTVLLDKGTVQKVIVLPKDTTTTEELILEEVEVFRVSSLHIQFNIWFDV